MTASPVRLDSSAMARMPLELPLNSAHKDITAQQVVYRSIAQLELIALLSLRLTSSVTLAHSRMTPTSTLLQLVLLAQLRNTAVKEA